MKPDKAIQHLIYKFKTKDKKKDPQIWINQKEREALASIVEFYNESTNTLSQSQEPFAKMYLYLYLHLLRSRDYHEQEVLPARILSEVLNHPVNNLMQQITEHVNHEKMHEISSKHFTIDKPSVLMTKEEKAQNDKELQEAPKDILKQMSDATLSSNEISNKLTAHINKILEVYVSL